MHLKLKTLVAAVAFAAAGMANAAFVVPTATGTGGMTFAAVNADGTLGYIQNLGSTYTAFNSGNVPLSTNLGSTFTSNFNTSNASTWSWYVFNDNGNNLITTLSSLNTGAPEDPNGGKETVGQIATINAAIQTYMFDVQNAAGTADSLLVTSPTAVHNPIQLVTGYAANLAYSTNDLIGFGSMNFYKMTAFGPAYNPSTVTQLAGTWTLASNGDLTYSVSNVPLPAAVWLFGSGLLGLVGVARRRKT